MRRMISEAEIALKYENYVLESLLLDKNSLMIESYAWGIHSFLPGVSTAVFRSF